MTDAELEASVREDIRCHLQNHVDLNPYSTVGARHSWNNGFHGREIGPTDTLSAYKRGQMAAKLVFAGWEGRLQ